MCYYRILVKLTDVKLSLNSAMFACSWFKGSHTRKAIFEQFQTTVTSFKISNKMAIIITDNASNITKAFSLPGFPVVNEDDDGVIDTDAESLALTGQLPHML